MAQLTPQNSGIPDYFNTPNWANSPPLRKFVDRLPQFGAAKQNNLVQYIPVAIPDMTTYPGSDYYEIEVANTPSRCTPTCRPELGSAPAGAIGRPIQRIRQLQQVPLSGASDHCHQGPPVRIKFTNCLATGAGGDLFVPVDTTIMGAGPFTINYDPETKQPTATITGNFTQNRANLHLHGGRTPWISDGTPHQWITPAGETTDLSQGRQRGLCA